MSAGSTTVWFTFGTEQRGDRRTQIVRVMNTTTEGGCLCGTLRYRLTASPTRGSICYCVDCRRASAAPMVAWVSVCRENFALLSGDLKRIRYAERLRSFAPCCGTPILIQDEEDAEWIDVTTCSLDHPEEYPPKAAIWIEDRLPWMSNAASLPEFPRSREGP